MNPEAILHQLKHCHAKLNNYCSTCSNNEQKLYHCENCKMAVYCGKSCQKQDWSKHKSFCLVSEPEKRGREDDLDEFDPKGEVGGDKRIKTEDSVEEVVPFGSLPKGVIETIAKFLGPSDIRNFRAVAAFITNNPGIIRLLQNRYVYSISNLDKIMLDIPIDWTRGIKKLQYKGTDHRVIKQLQYYFDSTRITWLTLAKYTHENLNSIRSFTNITHLELDEYQGNLYTLRFLTKLEYLSLPKNTENIDSIRHLKNLWFLKMDKFNGDLSPLENLQNLVTLFIKGYTGDNIYALRKMKKLRHVSLLTYTGNISLLRHNDLQLFGWGVQDGDISILKQFSNIKRLALRFYFGDISVLKESPQLNLLNLPQNHPHHSDWKEYLASLR